MVPFQKQDKLVEHQSLLRYLSLLLNFSILSSGCTVELALAPCCLKILVDKQDNPSIPIKNNPSDVMILVVLHNLSNCLNFRRLRLLF